jgi:hypothetical protein
VTEVQPLGQSSRVYSIMLMKKDSEWCVYQVKIKSDVNRDFFVELTAAQNASDGVIKRIEAFCESNFDRLPQDGGLLRFEDVKERNSATGL